MEKLICFAFIILKKKEQNVQNSDFEQKFNLISEENDRLRDENDTLQSEITSLKGQLNQISTLEEKLYQNLASYVCVCAYLESSQKQTLPKTAKPQQSIGEQLQALASSSKSKESEIFI